METSSRAVTVDPALPYDLVRLVTRATRPRSEGVVCMVTTLGSGVAVGIGPAEDLGHSLG
jgi:hypothetical protein